VITMLAASVLVTSLVVMPTGASPSIRAGAPQRFGDSAAQATPTTAATHATKGVVKSIDATSLVIARSGRRTKEQTFAMDASTHQVGRVTVGATVEVRYRTEEGHRLATVVSVQEPKVER
jgi:hypothetical protein